MDKEFNFKKKFGQNFIHNEEIINRIATAITPKHNNLVIEVGPGGGALTKKLKNHFDNVLAYEIDLDLKSTLEKEFHDSNVSFIFDDFMIRNIEEDVSKYSVDHIYFVANLPYYITTPIVQKIINSKLDVESIVIMVQKEVADRFSANVGTKEYNSLTVFLNYYYDIKKLFVVSRNNFYPIPNVDSAVVQLSKKENIQLVKNEDLFFSLVRDSFKYKRKTLKNNLKGYNLDKIEVVLNRYSMDLSIRAEQLPLDVFIEIANNLGDYKISTLQEKSSNKTI